MPHQKAIAADMSGQKYFLEKMEIHNPCFDLAPVRNTQHLQ